MTRWKMSLLHGRCVHVLAMFLMSLANIIWPSYAQAFLDLMASPSPGYLEHNENGIDARSAHVSDVARECPASRRLKASPIAAGGKSPPAGTPPPDRVAPSNHDDSAQ